MSTEADEPGPLAALVERSRFVVCVGTGGVGKTTVAAAVALGAAEHGRTAVVVTIDPAKRLADALGLDELGNEPHPLDGLAGGSGTGSLHALMLDTKATFDALVRRNATDDEQAERILGSRFYQTIAGSLSGTGEYMAMEKLHELHESGRFDLIVVDTPPAQHTLAFLDAPRLVNRLLENRLYRVLVRPTRGLARTATTAAHALVRQLTRIVGTDVVDDALRFCAALDGMEHGFEQHAQAVLRLLRSDDSAFVLVASPRPDTVDVAARFATQLTADGIAVAAVVANRVTPSFGSTPRPDGPAAHERNLAELQSLAAHERRATARLRTVAPRAVHAEVPLLADEVHELDALRAVGRHLLGWGGVAPNR